MSKLNLLLLIIVAATAVLLVTSEHKARQLNMGLEDMATRMRLLDADYQRLRSDAALLGTIEHVAKTATDKLKMREPGRRTVEISVPSLPCLPSVPGVPGEPQTPDEPAPVCPTVLHAGAAP